LPSHLPEYLIFLSQPVYLQVASYVMVVLAMRYTGRAKSVTKTADLLNLLSIAFPLLDTRCIQKTVHRGRTVG